MSCMRPSRDQPGEGQEANCAGIRQQLIALIKKRKRRTVFTTHRPTEVRPWEILCPESGLPLAEASMWSQIVRLLESGIPLKRTPIRQPSGEIAWVCRARLAPNSPLIYIKLQILGSRVLLRSFHTDEYDD